MSRIVLDTGVLWRPAALDALRPDRRAGILPAIAYTERARQFWARGWPVEDLDLLLAENAIDVEPFEKRHGLRYAARIGDEDRWHRWSRDAMIAGHVGPDDELWTTNPRDFIDLGVPPEQVVAV